MGNPWDRDWSAPATDAAAAATPWTRDWAAAATPADEARAPVSTGQDMANAGAAGVVKGAIGLAGSGKDIPDLIDMLANAGNKKLVSMGFPGAVPRDAQKLFDNPLPGAADITPKVEDALGGKLYEAQTTPGKFAAKVGEFLPGAIAGPANGVRGLIGNVARNAVAPGIASEGAGELAHAYAPQYETIARIAGGVAPGMLPAGIAPRTASAASHAEHAALLRQEGVPITAGESSRRRGLNYLEDTLSPNHAEAQREAFTAAATRRGGAETNVLAHGPDGTAATLLRDTGQTFDDLQRANTLHVDPALQNGVNAVHAEYTRTPGLYNDETVNAITGAGHRIADVSRANGGAIPGDQYQALRSEFSKAAANSTNPDRAAGLRDLVEHLDTAMGRSIQRTGGDPRAWDQARDAYRRALVIEHAAEAAGKGVSRGELTPANLLAASKAVYGKRAVEAGRDPFSDLAHAGNAVFKDVRDSGTAHRTAINNAITGTGVLAGGALAYGAGGKDPETDVAHLLLGEAGGGALGALLVRPGMRAAVMNQVTQELLRHQAAARTRGAVANIPGLLTTATALRQ